MTITLSENAITLLLVTLPEGEARNALVNAITEAERATEDSSEDFDDSMDGDFDSAMASAGHGTDEDYEHNSFDEGEW